ncbi:MAG: hypothetical protein ABSD31_19305 [Candidatus Binataceae bacterium]|jgi:hypothetical protein
MSTRAIALRAWLALSIGVTCLAGCGIKTRPRPPEDVRPEVIADLRARPVGDGIRLDWTRPEKYQNGDRMRDLSEFVLLRAEGNELLSEVAKLPVTDQQRFQQQHDMYLVDKGTLMGHRYRYRVISLTSDGYQSLPSNEAAIVRTPPPQPGAARASQPGSATESKPGGAPSPSPLK